MVFQVCILLDIEAHVFFYWFYLCKDDDDNDNDKKNYGKRGMIVIMIMMGWLRWWGGEGWKINGDECEGIPKTT